jgi:signal transduction histidine kinase
VPTGYPQTALAALSWRRLLVSGWPWRCAGYLFTTVPVAIAALVILAIPSLPWLALTAGGYKPATIVVLILVSVALFAGLMPLLTTPLAGVERRRLRIVDLRPTAFRPPPTAGHDRPVSWLRARYTQPATWRVVGYVCLLATVAPVLSIATLLVLPVLGSFAVSPVLVLAQQPGSAPVVVAFGKFTTVGQTVPYVIVGVLLLPAVPYLLTVIAGGHAAIARRLLLDGSTEQLRAELVEVSRSRARLVDAFEAERRRIERDLHDGAQQRLVSLTLQLGLARLDLPPNSPATEAVAAAHDQAKHLMAELRELIHGIQPQILTDLGLPAALGELADHASIPVAVHANLTTRLPSQVEATAYFASAEALTNIAKHSNATNASVTASQQGDRLTLEISDNGQGGADPSRGTGLTGLADRVAVIDGRMLLSSPDGGPTILRVELPCTLSQPPSR